MNRVLATCACGLLAFAPGCAAALAGPVLHGSASDIAMAAGETAGGPLRSRRSDAGSRGDDAPFTLDPLTTGGIRKAAPLAPSTRTLVTTAPAANAPSEAPVSREMTGSVGEPSAAPETAQAAAEAEAGAGHVEQAAATRSPMPFDIIRTLQFLQDQIARGNGRAIRVQAMLLRRFGPVFVDANPSVWKDERNRRAAILFVLSGGPPEVLKRLLEEGVLGEAQKPLYEGALAYVANDLKTAERLFASVDLAPVEPGLAAHLSLVLGQVKQNDHPAEAIAHLDRARLLAPGGLIEEAALRLEVVLVDKLGDHRRADRLARQYFDRFANSSYAGNFQARFAMVYADRGAGDGPAALATVLDITRRLKAADRRSLLLAISRRSLLDGNLEFAHLAGAEALKSDGIADEDLQRGNLYAAAAALGTSDSVSLAEELQTIDRTKLHPADVELLNAANSVLSRIDAALPAEPSSAATADVAPLPVFDRAQRLLDAVAGDLKDQTP